MSGPRGKKSLPTRLSSTEDFPDDCDPTTATWGRSSWKDSPPAAAKASWTRFIAGMRTSPSAAIPFPP